MGLGQWCYKEREIEEYKEYIAQAKRLKIAEKNVFADFLKNYNLRTKERNFINIL